MPELDGIFNWERTMKTISFTIFQEPTGKKAVQHTKTGIAYHGKDQRYNEDALVTEMLPYRPDKPITEPIKLFVRLYFQVPKSKSQWWKEAALVNSIYHSKKPDDDNCRKQIADCLEKLQFIKNDSQIWQGITHKYYSDKPRWEIDIVITPNITWEEWKANKKGGVNEQK